MSITQETFEAFLKCKTKFHLKVGAVDLRRTCAKLCHDRGGELEQIQFLLGHASVQTTERYLGCKQNLGHPVNDLFDLRMDGQQQAKHVQSVPADGASEGAEKAFAQGLECGHGGSEHEQPICDPKHVSLPERADVVEIGKSHRPHSFRRCSEAGTSGRHPENKADGEPDQGTRGQSGSWNIT